MTLVISPRRLTFVLLLIVLGLMSGDIVTRYILFAGWHDHMMGWERQLNLESENNLPTWYSSIALLLAAGLLFIIALAKREEKDQYRRHWLGLAIIFVGLSLDETASLHEMTAPIVHTYFHPSGYLYYGWVIPVGILVSIVGMTYMGFLRHLPFSTRTLFVLAGAIFVGGAMGMDMVEAMEQVRGGYGTTTYAIMVGIEEGMEMLAIVLFVYALSTYIAKYCPEVHLAFRENTLATVSQLPPTSRPVRSTKEQRASNF
jgi:hypothetical protein